MPPKPHKMTFLIHVQSASKSTSSVQGTSKGKSTKSAPGTSKNVSAKVCQGAKTQGSSEPAADMHTPCNSLSSTSDSPCSGAKEPECVSTAAAKTAPAPPTTTSAPPARKVRKRVFGAAVKNIRPVVGSHTLEPHVAPKKRPVGAVRPSPPREPAHPPVPLPVANPHFVITRNAVKVPEELKRNFGAIDWR
jgi:hypothetical protein